MRTRCRVAERRRRRCLAAPGSGSRARPGPAAGEVARALWDDRAVNVNWVGVRNGAIIAAVAALAVVWQEGFAAIVDATSLIILVLFVAAVAAFGFKYFRQNRLAWLILKPWQRIVIIAAGAGIAVLIIGFPWLSDVLTPLGTIALAAALVLLIVWIVRESRRWR